MRFLRRGLERNTNNPSAYNGLAWHLAERGIRALVLEAREPGWGASGNNGGQLNPGLKLDPDTIEECLRAEVLAGERDPYRALGSQLHVVARKR